MRLPFSPAIFSVPLVALALAGTATGSSPNVSGIVVGVPYSPPCVSGEPCDQPARPVLGFVRAGTVTRVRIGSGGRIAAMLVPGVYTVRLVPQQAGVTVRPRSVRVAASGMTRITVRIAFPNS